MPKSRAARVWRRTPRPGAPGVHGVDGVRGAHDIHSQSPGRPTQLARNVIAALTLSLLSAACEEDTCEEDIRAQVLEARAQLQIGDSHVDAEVAQTEVERERGWKHRRCDREGLLLIAPVDGELRLWGCGLAQAVDVHWIRDEQLLDSVLSLEPCAEPCDDCPIIEPGQPVDAALEVPSGALEVAEGDAVAGLRPWLPGAP